MAEQVGHGGRAGQQRRVGRELLNRVALAGATRTELHEVVVALAERNEACEEEQLQPTLHDRGLVADAANHQVEPLVRGQLGALLAVLLEVERGKLDGDELVDPEGVLALRLFVVLETHVDLGPDAPGQQAIEVADVVVGNVGVLVTKIRDFGPVLGINEPYLHLVDEGVLTGLLHLALCLGAFIGPDVVVG